MAGFADPAFYGDRWADVYDEHHGRLDPAAGLRLAERYGDWDRRPFGSLSAKHISVYRRD
jgi:hypothetical protein